MKVDKQYAAGFLENIGSFYLIRVNKRKTLHPIFKMVVLKKLKKKVEAIEMVLDFLFEYYGIAFKKWEGDKRVVYQLNRYDMVVELLKFFEENCYVKSKNQDRVAYYIKRREEG